MMNRSMIPVAAATLIAISACTRHPGGAAGEKPQTFGAALISVSGEKQVGGVGGQLDQPLVVQVNDAQGAAVAGTLVRFAGSGGVIVIPDHGITGSDGQFSASVSLGEASGHYQILVSTPVASGPSAQIRIDEIALGYQEVLGAKLNEMYCIRCHDSESTPERVSNHDNLNAKPHSFTEGSVLNAMSDADLIAITSHGGAALNKSAEMPPYGNMLTKSEIAALVAFMRAVADPPYPTQGVFYASN
jgi:mono/diheme cytochrome c family protein